MTALKGTVAAIFYNKELDIVNSYFIQFSFKDPWFIPHKEYRFNNGSWLCGWLFFYFGNITSNAPEKKPQTVKIHEAYLKGASNER